MCDTMGFVRHCADTGTVFAGTGMVWKIPTHSRPMKNPNDMEIIIKWMVSQITEMKWLGLDGIVFGVLTLAEGMHCSWKH